MGSCKSLQHKAYITGAFHLVLSVFELLFLTLVFLHQATDETRNQKYLEGDERKSNRSDLSQTASLINNFKNIIIGRISISDNISYKTAIGSALILCIPLADLSINVLLIRGVNKRETRFFVPWLIFQGIRILVCITACVVIVSLYIFDLSSSVRVTENHTIHLTETVANDPHPSMKNNRFLPP